LGKNLVSKISECENFVFAKEVMKVKLTTTVFSILVLLSLPMSAARAEGSTFDIPKLDGITIDGSGDDWVQRGFRVEVMTGLKGKILPPDNLDVKFRLGWNEQGLLVLVTVSDNTTVEYHELPKLYQKDSVELFIAESVGSENRYQMLVASGADAEYGKLRRHFIDYRPGKDNLPELTAHLVSTTTQTGYAIEALLPWENLGVDATLGMEAGFQLYVNDSDVKGETPEARVQIPWYPALNSHQNSKAMHRLRLANKPSGMLGVGGRFRPGICRVHRTTWCDSPAQSLWNA